MYQGIEWVNKIYSIHTMEHHLATIKNEVIIHSTTWMNLEKHYAKSKKPIKRDHVLYDPIYMKSPE